MLRSIIAIWTLAFLLVLVAATASGCDRGADLANSCPSACGVGCAGDQFCYQPSGAAELPAFCAHACADDRDCASGEKCAALFAALQPAICISAGDPHGCGGASPNWHCDLGPAACKDANTAQVGFSDAQSQVCGWAQVHCANGCANGACL